MCYGRCAMDSSVSVRELRNNVSAVLRRVESGERLTVTVDRRPVAELIPLRRRRHVPVAEALKVANRLAADPGLLADLAVILPDTTDDA
jgi:prevent-host-death family protein